MTPDLAHSHDEYDLWDLIDEVICVLDPEGSEEPIWVCTEPHEGTAPQFTHPQHGGFDVGPACNQDLLSRLYVAAERLRADANAIAADHEVTDMTSNCQGDTAATGGDSE